jgi:arylsulfatase A-like enzyme
MYDDQEVEDLREVIFSLYGPSDQMTERELKRMRANYAGEVTMVDRWLGKFIDKLEQTGKLDDTVLVVVSDHGHCIGEQGLISKQGYPLSREIADLVMLLRYPDGTGAGKVCDALCYHHDIPATILSALGQDLPGMDGKDLRPVFMDGLQLYDHTTTAWGPFVMVRDDDWWYNAYLWGDEPMLFDLKADPRLLNDIAGKEPEVVKRMADLALQDAKGKIPDYLREVAESNVPGCTPLVPRLMT